MQGKVFCETFVLHASVLCGTVSAHLLRPLSSSVSAPFARDHPCVQGDKILADSPLCMYKAVKLIGHCHVP